MELEGSNKELSDLWVVVINHRKNIIVNKQKENSKEQHTNKQKHYLKTWLKNALHEGGNIQLPAEKEGTFQIKVKGIQTPSQQQNEEKAEKDLKELRSMQRTIQMLQKSLLIWARV